MAKFNVLEHQSETLHSWKLVAKGLTKNFVRCPSLLVEGHNSKEC